MKHLKSIWILSFVILFVCLGWFSSSFPEVVPSKYDFQGNVIHSMEKNYFILFYILFGGGMNLFFFILDRFIPKLDPKWINWPSKDWWLETDERKRIMYQRISSLLHFEGIIVNVISLFILLMIMGTMKLINFPISEKFGTVLILIFSLSTIIGIPWFIKKPQSLA